jgi:hypothetical protein
MFVASTGIGICILLTAAVQWLGLGNRGRDVIPLLAVLGILICLYGVWVRFRWEWSLADFLIGLLPAEIVTLLIIAHLTGSNDYYGLDLKNLPWLVFANGFVGVPWLLGYAFGSILWLQVHGWK